MRRPRRRPRRDRGSMAVELVIAAPALVALLLILSAGGEWLNLNGAVGAAARDAARAASLARDAGTANADAQQAARADLGDICVGSVQLPPIQLYAGAQATADFATAQEVRVTVSCAAQLGVFSHIGYTSAHTFTAVAYAPLDPFVDRVP